CRRMLCVVELGDRVPARVVAAGGRCGDACTVRGECPDVFTPVPRGGFVVDAPSCRQRLQRVGDRWLFDVHFVGECPDGRFADPPVGKRAQQIGLQRAQPVCGRNSLSVHSSRPGEPVERIDDLVRYVLGLFRFGSTLESAAVGASHTLDRRAPVRALGCFRIHHSWGAYGRVHSTRETVTALNHACCIWSTFAASGSVSARKPRTLCVTGTTRASMSLIGTCVVGESTPSVWFFFDVW